MVAILDIVPQPALRPICSKWGAYNPPKYADYLDDLRYLFTDIKKEEKFYSENLLELSAIFYVPIPKSWSKKKKNIHEGKYCKVRPDLSNYIKAIEDAMEGIFFKNDSQIALYGKCAKIYSSVPRIEFELKEIT
jgi:Holliday junction resolvase RusA-like endonuclease